ncbi:MAG: hypothetical protein CL661_10765 [Bacteroidetes bacterium]|jgi:hypothetical protein|nr:hypothetical protein [Bacteroidota bacterium]|tara:strand:- start:4 stop:630 length:627 start_codon:yes stop_codon:yes gene_type:complete
MRKTKIFKEMKKTLIQIGLFIVIVALGYFVYDSIMEPVRFNKEKRQREKVVIERLKDIRSSQFIFKQLNGSYAPDFDTLISFLKIAEIPVVKIIPDPNDTTYTLTINDTVGYIKVADSLFGKQDNFQYTQLMTIPFSGGELFALQADTIERGGVEVHVFEAKAPFTAFLKGMNEQAIINIISKFEDIERYPGLRVGSLTEPSTDGNWE